MTIGVIAIPFWPIIVLALFPLGYFTWSRTAKRLLNPISAFKAYMDVAYVLLLLNEIESMETRSGQIWERKNTECKSTSSSSYRVSYFYFRLDWILSF